MGYQMKEAPVEEGKEYDMEITEISKRGDGLARVQGFVVFVPNTKVGEKVHIKITKVGDRFAIGEVI
jgi:predicted RNA-binding protein with TRAM domain